MYDDTVPRELAERLGTAFHSQFYGTSGGRWPGDLGLLYRSDLLEPLAPRQEYPEPGSSSRCRSVVEPLLLRANGCKLLISVNHWRSPKHGRDYEVPYDHIDCARWLWEVLNQPDDPARVAIVMGDFNIAPSSGVWSSPHALATRFCDEAQQGLTPLYNTGWRFLQDPVRADSSLVRPAAAWPLTRGSHKLDGGDWLLLDQLLVSGQALGGGIMTLSEGSICYAAPPSIARREADEDVPAKWVWDPATNTGTGMSDHFPLIARFELPQPGADNAI